MQTCKGGAGVLGKPINLPVAIAKNRLKILLALFAAVYFLAIFHELESRRRNFEPIPDDEIFVNSYYNAAQGRGFSNDHEIHHFHIHFSPIMYAFLPFFMLFSSPGVLDAAHIAAIVLAAFFLFGYARFKFESETAALFCAIAFLIFPPTIGIALCGFHPLAWVAPFIALFWDSCEKGRWKKAAFALFLLLIVRQDAAIAAFCMGLLVFAKPGNRKFGAAVIASSAAYFILVVFFLMPMFSPEGRISEHLHRHDPAIFGDSIGAFALGFFKTPEDVLAIMFQPDKLKWAATFLWPILFLPLLGVELYLCAAPAFIINFTSSFAGNWRLGWHHQSIFAVFSFLAIVYGVSRLVDKLKLSTKKKHLFQAAVFLSIIAACLGGLLFNTDIRRIFSPHDELLRPAQCNWKVFSKSDVEFAKSIRIPEDASLACARSFGSRFATRKEFMGNLIIKRALEKQYDFILTDQKVRMPDAQTTAALIDHIGKNYKMIKTNGRLGVFINKSLLRQKNAPPAD